MVDPVALARVQFAANISFHILFPAITMALAWVLLFFKLRFSATGERRWLDAYLFWIKVFALSFALGVVSGLTMSFQFGTNWPGFMDTVGNIAGPLLGYEVLTAFFLEATFLGIMLFGRKRVGERMHTLATAVVAIGTSFSAFWILSLNSWMQTPAGFEMIDGQAHVLSWWAVVFNPSFPYRLAHMLLASGLTAAFLIAGLSAYRMLRNDQAPAVRSSLRVGVLMAVILIPIQILVGDLHGLNTLEHQPAKIAAMEGVWRDERSAPALLFAWPDEATRSNRHAIGVPALASLILTHTLDGEIKGLDSFPDAHPPVAPVFWAFRVMVATGMLMLLVSWLTAWTMRRDRMPGRWGLRLLVVMTFSGWLATLAGWYVSEIGRQPWLVYGVLKTADAAAAIPAPMIALSLGAYLVVYLLLLLAYVSVLFYMARHAGDRQPVTVPAVASEA
jgi:cytochrome bd ubiquinol oxidase subunit I